MNQTAHRNSTPIASRIPFYYGWVILAAGTLGIMASIPGQTMGVSAFTDSLIEALEISRVNISTAYMIGTLASALLLPFAGKLYDRFGARITAAGAGLFLGLFLLFLSVSGRTSAALLQFIPAQPYQIGFFITLIAFFGIRFFGQGVLTLVSRGMIVKWFTSRRGLAVAVIGVATSFGFSYAPRPIYGFIDVFGWDGALTALALILILFFMPFSILVYRDSPRSCGMKAEEGLKKKPQKKYGIQDTQVSKTAAEAKQDIRFWIIILLLGLWALVNTALTFHIVSIFRQVEVSASEALRIFLPVGIISFAVKALGSWLSDRTQLKVYVLLLAFSVALSGFALFSLGKPYAQVLLIAGMGTAGGVFALLQFITWPRLYGTNHLGAVSGFAMGFIVGGSAIGPWLFSLIYQVFGGYSIAGLGSAVIAVLLMTGALFLSFSPEEAPAQEKPARTAAGTS